MKKIITILLGSFLILISFNISFSQTSDSTKLKVISGSEIMEMNELFRIEDVEYFKIVSRDTKLKNYYFQFSIKEFLDKKMIRNDTLLKDFEDDKVKTGYREKDTEFIITLTKRNVNKDTSKFLLSFHNSGLSTYIVSKKIPFEDYSTRDVLMSYNEWIKVPIEKTFPLLVYTLPYENPKYPGYKFYCELSKNGVPPEKWVDVYGVKHELIIYLTIRKK